MPHLERKGGVAALYANLRPHFPPEVSYFVFGSPTKATGLVTRIFRTLYDYLRFVFRIVRERPDLVQVNPSIGSGALIRDGGFLLIALFFGRKVVVFIHGWNMEREQRLRRRWPWLFRLVYFRAHAFIVLAEDFARRLRDMGYAGPVHLGVTAIADEMLERAKNVHSNGRDVGKAFNILFLAHVEREKGIMESLAAYAIVKAKHPHVSMTVAGDGAYLGAAQRFVIERNLPDVHFIGYVRGDQKAETLTRAQCYLFPSYTEGMPISVLEAMTFGLPVITRPVGALADFFRDGEMGFLTESKDPAVFGDLLERLLSAPDLCETISLRNREYAIENFAPASVALRLTSIYDQTLLGKRI